MSDYRNTISHMEDQLKDSAAETDDFPDDFQCSVCLDLLFKPVVLACGHISCFWCVFKAMDSWQDSRCPVCRHPFNHFPSICQLLHFLLLKKYPLVYKTREGQVTEEEKDMGSFSPQFEDYLSRSDHVNKLDKLGGFSQNSSDSSHKLHVQSCAGGKGDSSIEGSSDTIVPGKDYAASPVTSHCEATTNGASHNSSSLESKLVCGTSDEVLIADLLCGQCKQLLCLPVVLNCGHVYCKTCVINPSNKEYRCQSCGSVHPNGFPKVCLVLEHFLEEQFPEEYAARKETVLSLADSNCGSPSTTTEAQQNAAKSSTIPPNTSLFGRDTKVHRGFGCDFCGMFPIIGERYKCEDCKEAIGFDLCEGCYKSSSKLPGRFNQQHTPEHKFKIEQPYFADHLLWRLHAENSEEDDYEDPDDVSSTHIMLGLAIVDEEDDASTAPVPSNYNLDDREARP